MIQLLTNVPFRFAMMVNLEFSSSTMKPVAFTSVLLTIVSLAASAIGTGCASNSKPVAVGAVKPYPLPTCIVSGDKLGAMGEGCTFVYQGQEVKLCCKDCKKDFDKNPAKYISQLTAK